MRVNVNGSRSIYATTPIAQTIYGEIRGTHAWGRRFPEQLGEDALAALAAVPPRTMRRALLHGFGAARLDGRDAVRADDIRADDGMPKRRPIGF